MPRPRAHANAEGRKNLTSKTPKEEKENAMKAAAKEKASPTLCFAIAHIHRDPMKTGIIFPIFSNQMASWKLKLSVFKIRETIAGNPSGIGSSSVIGFISVVGPVIFPEIILPDIIW